MVFSEDGNSASLENEYCETRFLFEITETDVEQ